MCAANCGGPGRPMQFVSEPCSGGGRGVPGLQPGTTIWSSRHGSYAPASIARRCTCSAPDAGTVGRGVCRRRPRGQVRREATDGPQVPQVKASCLSSAAGTRATGLKTACGTSVQATCVSARREWRTGSRTTRTISASGCCSTGPASLPLLGRQVVADRSTRSPARGAPRAAASCARNGR